MDESSSGQDSARSTGQENTSFGRNLDRCSFCNVRGDLIICDHCSSVAYCTQEHQRFDWKKHKPICKTILSKLNGVRLHNTPTPTERLPLHNSINESESNSMDGFENGSRPSSSQEQRSADDSDERSPETSEDAAANDFAKSPSTEARVSPSFSGERIIETDDPDIQIIEGPSTAGQSTPLRPRKRAVPSRILKDHSQNKAYNVTPEEHRRYLMEQGRAFNQHQSAELRLTYISEHILRALTEYGWAVIDNFLGMDHCWHVHKEIRVLESRGLFGAGQLVEAKNKDEQHVKDIRSDKTYWFSGSDEQSSDACTIRMLISYLDGIVNRFSRRLPGYQIHGRSKAMLAIYPGNGSRYVKHVDNPAKDGRRITVIYYCNPDWDHTKDGGVLRLYPESSATPLDVEPKADRLIAFWSDHRIPHEVMPVYKDRLAITVWYMDRNERDKHIKKTDPKAASAASATAVITAAKPLTTSSLEETCTKGAKEQRLETPQPMETVRTTDEPTSETDDTTSTIDSGRGASLPANSVHAFSLQSRAPHNNSVDISDDDEAELPMNTELNPEYNI